MQLTTFTEYDATYPFPIAFPPQAATQYFGEVLQAQGLTNMRLAETEKYPHVTYFFNGGIETPFTGEDRVLLPSPKVATYDLQPEMSAAGVADAFVDSVTHHKHDVIICNFANPDMVGHTGVLAAAIAAIKAVDACLGRCIDALLAAGGTAIVTADHGNAEQMWDYELNAPHTAHTTNLVPGDRGRAGHARQDRPGRRAHRRRAHAPAPAGHRAACGDDGEDAHRLTRPSSCGRRPSRKACLGLGP